MIRARMLAGAAAVALVAAGCGPHSSVHLTLRNYASDITYGDQHPPTPPAPVPAAALQPTFPAFIQPPLNPALPALAAPPTTFVLPAPAPPPLPQCAKASAFAFPAATASPHVLAPPVAAVYAYHQAGTYSVDGKTGTPAAHALRAVQNVKTNSDGTFTFDVADLEDGAVTLTSYKVDQRNASSLTDGLFVTQVVTRAADGTIDQFAPTSPIRIMPLPADNTQTKFASAGVDPIHGLTEQLSGAITGHQRVDACGTVLDSWQVHVTGKLLSSAEDLDFDATYDVGTQFGGLSLEDTLEMTGTDQGGTVSRTTTSIIDFAPRTVGATG